MKYIFDSKKFKQKLLAAGYENLNTFAVKTKIHRNTLQNLLKGRSVFTHAFSKVASMLKIDPLELIVPHSQFATKEADVLRPIVAMLLQQNKKMAIVLLGSRAKGKAQKYSDWDIGIFNPVQPITGMEYLKMKQLTEEMAENMVQHVDLVNLNQAPTWFLEDIGATILFLDGDKDAFIYLKGVLNGIQREKQVA